MEEKIKNAFDAVHMSENCAAKIEEAMAKQSVSRSPARRIQRLAAAAACLIAVLLTITNPSVVQALEEVYNKLTGKVYIDQNRYIYDNGKIRIEGTHNWNIDGSVTADAEKGLTLTPDIENGRLYFTGNGEKIDITDLISYDTAFTYVFTEESGITHYIGVGGEFTPETGLNNVGTFEFLRYQTTADDSPASSRAGWMGGYYENYRDETGDVAQWIVTAAEELGIPWSPLDGQAPGKKIAKERTP